MSILLVPRKTLLLTLQGLAIVALIISLCLLSSVSYANVENNIVDDSEDNIVDDNLNDTVQYPRYLTKPNFNFASNRRSIPYCGCDDAGIALLSCEQQTVNLLSKLIINESGVPTSIEVIESTGYPKIDLQLVQSLRQARFSPSIVNGEPTPSVVRIPIQFKYRPNLPPVCNKIRKSQQ